MIDIKTSSKSQEVAMTNVMKQGRDDTISKDEIMLLPLAYIAIYS